jgi:tripartite-type tricarboxylate transporter receptor subunit TctC
MTFKNTTRRQLIMAPAAVAGLSMFGLPAYAQAYPTKAIKIVVPSPPGGSTDFLARIIGARLQAAWGQSVVIENKPGAGLRLGAELVAKAAPDGYTLLMGAVHHSIAQAVYNKRSYELERDLTPIVVVATVPNVLIVPTTMSVKNVQELIALAKADPGKLAYGSTGTGTANSSTTWLVPSCSMFLTKAALLRWST